MTRIDNTRKNRNFLRLAALGAVVFLVTTFGGSESTHRSNHLRHAALEQATRSAEFQHQATRAQSSGSENSQLSLMIFRSN